MYNYQGITPKTIELLCLNRFNDSKAFYEKNKEALKQGATIPMRQIMLDLSDFFTNIDINMYTEPVYTVSRIRRDTRRSKNKMMYRENLWIMFRRNKKMYPNAPFFWYEFTPEGYNYGIAYFTARPAHFDYLRQLIIEQPKRWLKAVKTAEKAGLQFGFYDSYKTDRVPTAPEKLKKYLNIKNIQFMHFDSDLSKINSPDLIDELKIGFKAAIPLYDFFIEAYYNMIAKEQIL